ncbi:MAG: hypothetical protein JWR04_2300 [Rhodoglobus sp.]|nr:hypothetical protein [Rhodoglobus sp.]
MDRTRTPLWVHIAGAVIAGAAFVAVFLAPEPSGVWSLIGVVALIVFSRVTKPLRPPVPYGRVGASSVVLGVVAIALVAGILAGTWYLVRTLGLDWVAWVAGAALVVLGIVGGVLEDRIRTRASE